jgi:hypothetical protein
MSATYTLHVARGAAPGDPEALDRAATVRDGFSWGAFLVPELWFIRHRHWGLAALAFGAVIGTAWGLRSLGAGGGTILLVEVLLHALIGLEGASLRRWAYGLRGRPVADVVVAANEAEAEAKSFERWLSQERPDNRPAAAQPGMGFARPFSVPPVIGLFPDAEGRR